MGAEKPRPGLFLAAARELGIDPRVSYVVGDRKRDLEPGRALGCRAVLVRTGPRAEKDIGADFIASSLLEAVHWIIGEGFPAREIQALTRPY